MEKKIRIILADDNHTLCQMLQKYLQTQEEMLVVGIAHDGLEALELIHVHEPDLVILDLIMPNLDGLEVLERLKMRAAAIPPKIIAITAFCQEDITRLALVSGADYVLLKPFDLEVLSRQIRVLISGTQLPIPDTGISALAPPNVPVSAAAPPPESLSSAKPAEPMSAAMPPEPLSVSAESGDFNLRAEATAIMHKIGIPAHVKGYHYIREAIIMVVEDVSLLGAVTRGLYPAVAKKFGTEPNRVERGIRHAIELAWERGDMATLKQIFGYSMDIERQKPTNSEFIAHLADTFIVKGKVS